MPEMSENTIGERINKLLNSFKDNETKKKFIFLAKRLCRVWQKKNKRVEKIMTDTNVIDAKLIQKTLEEIWDKDFDWTRKIFVESNPLNYVIESTTGVKYSSQSKVIKKKTKRSSSMGPLSASNNVFQCSRCEKSYKGRFGRNNLSRHVREAHKYKGPLNCNKCNKKFMLKRTLDYHLQTKHNPEFRGYRCRQICSKIFFNYSQRRRHEMMCATQDRYINKIQHKNKKRNSIR